MPFDSVIVLSFASLKDDGIHNQKTLAPALPLLLLLFMLSFNGADNPLIYIYIDICKP